MSAFVMLVDFNRYIVTFLVGVRKSIIQPVNVRDEVLAWLRIGNGQLSGAKCK